jgi:hypothetical protein
LIGLNVRLVQQIHQLLGVTQTRLGLDGMVFKAWVEQVGTRSDDRERLIRKVAHNATPILLERRDGSREFTRGYRLVALVDLPTGLPLVWVLWPGKVDEARALPYLLNLLFDLWADIRVEAVVADAAWDESWAIEWCLVNYGIPLIAHRHPSYLSVEHPLTEFESRGISKYRGDGTLYCRKHSVPLIRDGFEMASRIADGQLLEPGEPANPGGFRLRGRCPIDPDCGRPSLKMSQNFAALAPHPHSVEAGAADQHAFRLAMFARRNANESLHSAIQIGNKLGLADAARMRTAKEPTVETLLSIALTQRSALMLADQRVRAGRFPAGPPRDLAARL